MATLAVISTGGKQYVVTQGSTIMVEKLSGNEGQVVTFDVMAFDDGAQALVGSPTVAGVSVAGEIVAQTYDKKVWGVKRRPKKRYKVMFGHRQPRTKVKITSIVRK